MKPNYSTVIIIVGDCKGGCENDDWSHD